MQLKIRSPFKWLSVLLAGHLAAPESGQLPSLVAQAVVGAGSLAIASASEIREATPAAKRKPTEAATPPAALRFSAEPTDAEIFNARVFDEPLVPSDGQLKPEENRALAGALAGYANRAVADDCSSLAAYTDAFPSSRWTGPLLLHLGTGLGSAPTLQLRPGQTESRPRPR